MRQEDTRRRILDQALELFAARGYDAVSVGEIAEAAGIKAPSLYNHFPSKQAIFDALVASTAARCSRLPPWKSRGSFTEGEARCRR